MVTTYFMRFVNDTHFCNFTIDLSPNDSSMKKALTLQHSLESVLLRKSKEGEQLLLNATCCLCTALVLDDIMWYLRLIEAVSGSWYFSFIHSF